MNAVYKYICFDPWRPWSIRDRPSHEIDDVPERFGIYGVYLIGEFKIPPVSKVIELKFLPKEIIYIGMSSHIDRRLEKSHSAVKEYRHETGDNRGDNLWYSKAYLHGINSRSEKETEVYALFYERALILDYMCEHGELPKYNRY